MEPIILPETKTIIFERSDRFYLLVVEYLNVIFPRVLSDIILYYYTISLNWKFSNTHSLYLHYFDGSHGIAVGYDYECKNIYFKKKEEKLCHVAITNIDRMLSEPPYRHCAAREFFDYPFVYITQSSFVEKINCYDNTRETISVQPTQNDFLVKIKCVKNNMFYTGNLVGGNIINLAGKNSKYFIKNVDIYIHSFTENVKHQIRKFDTYYNSLYVKDIMVSDEENIAVFAYNRTFRVLVVFDKSMNIIYKSVIRHDWNLIESAKLLYFDNNEIIYTFVYLFGSKCKTMLCYQELTDSVCQEIVSQDTILFNCTSNLLFVHKPYKKRYDAYES